MARTDGGGTRRRAPAAALEADNDSGTGKVVDKTQGGAGLPEQGQGESDAPARVEFQISDDERADLVAARDLDTTEKAGGVHEDAFWAQLCAAKGANPATVEATEEMIERGVFTAWPMEQGDDRPFDPATNEADHIDALDRFEAIVAGAQLSLATLKGDLRDPMLDIFRNRHKSWSAMSPSEQRDVATAIDYGVEVLVQRVVRIVASEGRPEIKAQLENYTDKGGGEITAKIKIALADDDTVLALHRASGKHVLIVAADAAGFMGERKPVEIDREDPELEFDAGNDAANRASGDDQGQRHPADSSDLADAGDKVVDDEALYQRAVGEVRERDSVSVSMLQRVLGVGFDVATRIVDRMQAEGVVSAPDVTTKRTVLPWAKEPAAAEETA